MAIVSPSVSAPGCSASASSSSSDESGSPPAGSLVEVGDHNTVRVALRGTWSALRLKLRTGVRLNACRITRGDSASSPRRLLAVPGVRCPVPGITRLPGVRFAVPGVGWNIGEGKAAESIRFVRSSIGVLLTKLMLGVAPLERSRAPRERSRPARISVSSMSPPSEVTSWSCSISAALLWFALMPAAFAMPCSCRRESRETSSPASRRTDLALLSSASRIELLPLAESCSDIATACAPGPDRPLSRNAPTALGGAFEIEFRQVWSHSKRKTLYF